jgi:hypothetical protein
MQSKTNFFFKNTSLGSKNYHHWHVNVGFR